MIFPATEGTDKAQEAIGLILANVKCIIIVACLICAKYYSPTITLDKLHLDFVNKITIIGCCGDTIIIHMLGGGNVISSILWIEHTNTRCSLTRRKLIMPIIIVGAIEWRTEHLPAQVRIGIKSYKDQYNAKQRHNNVCYDHSFIE